MGSDDLLDVVIIGGGPAGLAAALYAARDRYRTLLVEKAGLPGGQSVLTNRIDNYPGVPNVSGFDLVERMRGQVADFGGEIVTNHAVDSITPRDDGALELAVNAGEKTLRTRAVILAPGSRHRHLRVPGEDSLREAGRVSYCATCDGPFYRDKHVLVVGGGNTAVEDAAYLARQFARKVTVVHRRREWRATQVLVDDLEAARRDHEIELKQPYLVKRLLADESGTGLAGVELEHRETGAVETVRPDGVFILIGMEPNTKWLRGTVEMDETGYIACDPVTLRTSMPGVFVAGDCRRGAMMQLVTACADGVVAEMMLKEYFRDPAWWSRPSQTSPVAGGR